MLVTINTDAAFHTKEKRAGYAFWAVCNDWRLMKYGSIKDKVNDSNEAEMKSIINAVFVVLNQGGKKVSKIIVNTDSMNAIHVFTKDCVLIDRYKLSHLRVFARRLNKIVNNINPALQIEYRHVKAHTSTDTARQWVNDWCDQHAKKGLWSGINKPEYKNG